MTWVVWVLAAVLVAVAGAGVIAVPRLRDRDLRRRTAWSAAAAAIGSAAVSRDAATTSQPEAEQLLTRAETIAARARRCAGGRSGPRPRRPRRRALAGGRA
jgi:uncharacterized membrane protein YhaH (DUF805 family)